MPSLLELRRAMHRPRPARGKGFSLIELLVVIGIIMIIATLAIPQVIRARMVANEGAAVSALRTLSSANMIYWNTYQQGYPSSLAVLGPPTGGGPASATNADLIDTVLAGGTRGGYTFLYAAVDTDGDGQIDLFSVHANPITPGFTGQRYFFVDQSHVIRFELNSPANASSQPIPSK